MLEANNSEELYAEYSAIQAVSARLEKRLLRETNLRDRFGADNGKKIKNLLKKLSHVNTTKSELKTMVSMAT